MSVSAATRLYDMVARRSHRTLEQALRDVGAIRPTPDIGDQILQGWVETRVQSATSRSGTVHTGEAMR